jgi:glutamate synthase domain-containing protein 1
MDMVIELLLMTGRTLPETMMMVVPESLGKTPNNLTIKLLQFNACVMEPWDPASIPFTNGNVIGATSH